MRQWRSFVIGKNRGKVPIEEDPADVDLDVEVSFTRTDKSI